ncbi:hypothetical protein FHX52_3316 [Humibacillus xanthopallidus]|uniref:Hemerythrin HHE cation binding domain-containing protein n=1 Tax=Humibacillus xanthopallidus TaxID=412689 RepID=A0A543PR87_9MICO|nr:hypothetical protein [Humibacillus xanthopallidus]TQN46590.1 hypothetical protein FHX52_3316 [Humibacillus xanthopallidus]
MQPRSAVTDVVRVVARQHTRMRGLVCEVAETTGAEQAAAAGWLSHYVVLHTVAERLGLRREPFVAVQRVIPRHGPLLGLARGLASASSLEESAICRCAAALEEAVVQHARAQELAVLPRLLAGWRAADLRRAAAAFEAADLVFDRAPSEPPGPSEPLDPLGPLGPLGPLDPLDPLDPLATTESVWRSAVADIERLLGSMSGEEYPATQDDATQKDATQEDATQEDETPA